MKIKYILWVICALLLLNTSVILAQEIGGTNTTGKVGFLEKEPIEKPPVTSSSQATGQSQILTNQNLPIVGTNQNDSLMPFVVGLVTIGVGSLMIKKIFSLFLKKYFNEKNNTQP